LSYISATYFASASVSMERVKGIEPSSQAWGAQIQTKIFAWLAFINP
jgi:hypothetical protein